MQLLHLSRTFEETECAVCGVMFFVPQLLDRKWRENGQGFFCPNGHSLTYGKSMVARLTEERDTARRERDDARLERDREERAKLAAQGTTKRLQKRIAAGVCPCCKRTFSNMARHMKSRHPGYAETTHAR